ncbi:hypothetical protein [uncultured Tenacibaculum sp.]|uniref:hypothetical protein n=1 Tax=uncultured Tenacibaculum sp. TaxID=174713 RepID=UPI0026049845|nr:hypothetical protein [uncultured Tenacibaculum sp.]
MNQEERNKEKRRMTSLTTEEWLGFFFVPINISRGEISIFPTNDFNNTEEDRFKKFNFDKKLKQSYTARVLDIIFYTIIFIVLRSLF